MALISTCDVAIVGAGAGRHHQHRARQVLEQLGLWQRLPADEIAPLRQAQVRDGLSPLVLPFDAGSQGHAVRGRTAMSQRWPRLRVARQLPPLRALISRQLTGGAQTSSHSLRT